MRSVRDRLLMSLTELQQMVMFLVQSIHGQTVNSTMEVNTNNVTKQIVEKQEAINEIIKEAEEQESIQSEILSEQREHAKLEGDVNKLQQQLRHSQQVLEAIVAAAHDKTERTQAAQQRQCTVEDLLSYAHLISSSCSTQMPANWTEMDYRRPYPTDIDMRTGELGKLAVQSGSLPELHPDMVTDRDNQGLKMGAWKKEGGILDNHNLLPVKQEMSSSEDDDLMEDVT